MRIRYKPGFRRDIRRIRDADTIRRINSVIADLCDANSIGEVSNIRRIRAARGSHYRVRIGDYRLGRNIGWRCGNISGHRASQGSLSTVSIGVVDQLNLSLLRRPETRDKDCAILRARAFPDLHGNRMRRCGACDRELV